MEPGDRARMLARIGALRREAAELEGALDLDPPAGIAPGTDEERVGLTAFRLFAEHASDFLSIHAANGDYLYASPSVRRLFGHDPAALVGRNAYELIHPEDAEAVASDHATVSQRSVEGAPLETGIQYRLEQEDGSYRWVETRSRSYETARGTVQIVAITRDVHETRLAQERAEAAEAALIRAEQARLLGQLARALAHELNNPLTLVTAQLPAVGLDPEAREVVRHGIDRLRSVVRELLTLAEVRPPQRERLSLGEVVARVVGLPERADTGVILDLPDDAYVMADRGRLYQLIHVCLAMHRFSSLEVPQVRVSLRPEGEWIVLGLEGGREPSHAVRADLLEALRGEAPHMDVAIKLAARIAEEVGARCTHDTRHGQLYTEVALPAA